MLPSRHAHNSLKKMKWMRKLAERGVTKSHLPWQPSDAFGTAVEAKVYASNSDHQTQGQNAPRRMASKRSSTGVCLADLGLSLSKVRCRSITYEPVPQGSTDCKLMHRRQRCNLCVPFQTGQDGLSIPAAAKARFRWSHTSSSVEEIRGAGSCSRSNAYALQFSPVGDAAVLPQERRFVHRDTAARMLQRSSAVRVLP
jgi:hypothetical protein